MVSAVQRFGHENEGWNLVEGSEAPRAFAVPVRFDAPFANVPLVHVSLAGFDIENSDAARIRVVARDVTEHGFTLVITSWLHHGMRRGRPSESKAQTSVARSSSKRFHARGAPSSPHCLETPWRLPDFIGG
jgi:hypothetical protein